MDSWILSLVSGLVGTIIGGGVTWFAQFQATSRVIRDQRERDERLDRESVSATLQAVVEEMRATARVHQASGGQEIEAADGKSPIAIFYPISDHYFAVFNANAGAIGRIRNPQLRGRLVETNVNFKALIDTIRLNNHFTELVIDAERELRHHPNSEQCKVDLDNAYSMQASYAPLLIQSHRRAIGAFSELDAVVRALGL